MPPLLALFLWLVVIVFLFVRDHKNHPGLSPSLWIPLVWLFLLGSRSLGSWLSLGTIQEVSLNMYAEGNPVDRYSLLLMFILATIIVLKRNLPWSSIIRENKIIFLFVLYCVISATWSEFPMIAIKRLIRFSGILPMSLLILSEHSPIESIMAVLRRCSYLLVSLSFLFIRYFPQNGRYYNPFTNEPGYCGVCSNKNELGIICLVACLVFLWDLMQKEGNISTFARSLDGWTTIIALLMTGYLLRMAHSATSLFCLLIGSSILLGTSLRIFKKNPRAIVYRVVGMSALIAVAELFFKISTVIIAALGRDPTLTNRSYLWKVLLGIGTNPIVGMGYGSFWTTGRLLQVQSMDIGAIQSHNGYIETYLNLGIIGVLFLLALLVRCFRIVAREMPAEFSFNQLRLAMLIVFILFNYTEAAFPIMGLLSAVFFLMIIMIPRKLEPRVPDSKMDHASPENGGDSIY